MVTKDLLLKESATLCEAPSDWVVARFFSRLVFFLAETADDITFIEEFCSEKFQWDGLSGNADYYRSLITEYPNPVLSEEEKQRCPIVAERLNTPQKLRALYSVAAASWVSKEHICTCAEEILKPHVCDGLDTVTIKYRSTYHIENRRSRGAFTSDWYRSGMLDRFSHYTQIEYEDLRMVLGMTRASLSCEPGGLFDDGCWVATWKWE